MIRPILVIAAAIVLAGPLLALAQTPSPAPAQEPAAPAPPPEGGQIEEGTGFSMFGTKSISGSGGDKVEKDPVCDRSKRPKIHKIEPDEGKPGDKVVIKGENFGTKECFHGVSFIAASGTKAEFTFVNDTTVEAVVPDARKGLTFVDVIAGGGNARSKAFFVKEK